MTRSVFAGEPGPARDLVALNAGAAIYVGGGAEALGYGIALAQEAIDSGAVRDVLERLARLSSELADQRPRRLACTG